MLFIQRIFLGILMLIIFSTAFSQSNNTTTIIIVRHAEKDTGNNPALTPVGMKRAEKLSSLFDGIKPDEIYSTPYIRTMQTITPWAKETAVEIKEYNPQNMMQFAEYLRALKGKTVVIAGHSNTNPQLVNLLINEDKYKNLIDTDYETIFIITIIDGVAKAKVMKNKN